jgi:hypothetical protein
VGVENNGLDCGELEKEIAVLTRINELIESAEVEFDADRLFVDTANAELKRSLWTDRTAFVSDSARLLERDRTSVVCQQSLSRFMYAGGTVSVFHFSRLIDSSVL